MTLGIAYAIPIARPWAKQTQSQFTGKGPQAQNYSIHICIIYILVYTK